MATLRWFNACCKMEPMSMRQSRCGTSLQLEHGTSLHSHVVHYERVMLLQAGETALILAAGDGHIEVVQCLLENGADVNASKQVWYRPATPVWEVNAVTGCSLWACNIAVLCCRMDGPH